MTSRLDLLPILGALACHARPGPSGPTAVLPDPAAAISAEALLETVRVLSGPDMEGRLPGGPGYDRAVAWAVARLRAEGLEPGLAPADPASVPVALGELARAGWLQPFPIEHAAISTCDLALVEPDGTAEPLALGVDFACRGFTGSGDVEAEVVFAGHGLDDPARGQDDYAGLDVAGKVVLAFKPAPPWSPGECGWGESWMPRPKAAVARAHGAAALLLVPRPSDPQPAIGSVMDGPGPAVPIPQLQVALPVAERIVAGTGSTLADLETRLATPQATASVATATRVRVRTAATYRPAVPTVNVVARIPGTDLAAEAVVVTAHLDHVGCQAGVCWPGANDDASGSAAVLAIAGALRRAAPRRTVYAVLYASEEHGLDGSKAFAAAPPVPVDRIVAQVNLDCIGIGDAVQVGGGQASPGLWEIARTIDAVTTRRTIADTWWGGGADAQALFDLGVPTLYFATHDAYAHLHLPSDTVDTLDPDLFADAVHLALRVVGALADGVYTREARMPEPPPETP